MMSPTIAKIIVAAGAAYALVVDQECMQVEALMLRPLFDPIPSVELHRKKNQAMHIADKKAIESSLKMKVGDQNKRRSIFPFAGLFRKPANADYKMRVAVNDTLRKQEAKRLDESRRLSSLLRAPITYGIERLDPIGGRRSVNLVDKSEIEIDTERFNFKLDLEKAQKNKHKQDRRDEDAKGKMLRGGDTDTASESSGSSTDESSMSSAEPQPEPRYIERSVVLKAINTMKNKMKEEILMDTNYDNFTERQGRVIQELNKDISRELAKCSDCTLTLADLKLKNDSIREVLDMFEGPTPVADSSGWSICKHQERH